MAADTRQASQGNETSQASNDLVDELLEELLHERRIMTFSVGYAGIVLALVHQQVLVLCIDSDFLGLRHPCPMTICNLIQTYQNLLDR